VAASSVLSIACAGCSAAEPDDKLMLPSQFRKLLPLHARLAEPQPGDWLDQHHEPGQTFRQYVYSRPIKPDQKRRVIYIQPLGDFSETQRKIVNLTAEFMGLYFDLPVKIREDLSLAEIPAEARRKHPSWGMDQILSTYVLHDVLRPRLPADAVVFLALTPSDLWPGEGWNFVFGQASLEDRVGVWSIYRNGDPNESGEAFRLCLRRTLKTATHETGHMFSMPHCTAYECNMCGSNHRAESDRRPLWLCPQCLAKLSWTTGADMEKRFEELIKFANESGLSCEGEFYQKCLSAFRE
jgi:archaemetzincin